MKSLPQIKLSFVWTPFDTYYFYRKWVGLQPALEAPRRAPWWHNSTPDGQWFEFTERLEGPIRLTAACLFNSLVAGLELSNSEKHVYADLDDEELVLLDCYLEIAAKRRAHVTNKE